MVKLRKITSEVEIIEVNNIFIIRKGCSQKIFHGFTNLKMAGSTYAELPYIKK